MKIGLHVQHKFNIKAFCAVCVFMAIVAIVVGFCALNFNKSEAVADENVAASFTLEFLFDDYNEANREEFEENIKEISAKG